MIRQRRSRSGITMTEVLVTLFVMALGAIAILTLFPLGMLQITQALKDDRTAQSASAADGFMRWYWKTYVVEGPTFDGNLTSSSGSAFDSPGGSLPTLTAANGEEASHPVAVDPIGWNVRSASDPSRDLVAGGVMARRNLAAPSLMPLSQSIRTCTMLDGLTYDINGLPDTSSGAVVRDTRYNWLWVLQRPQLKNPNIVTMDIVVFDKRGIYPSLENVFASLPPLATPITLTPGKTSLQLPFNSGVQKGMWIMDATNSGTVRHAYFYRVVSVTEDTANPAVANLELDSAIRRIDGNPNAYSGTIVVLAGVSEVFHRPMLVP